MCKLYNGCQGSVSLGSANPDSTGYGGGDEGGPALLQQADRLLCRYSQPVHLRRLRGNVGDNGALFVQRGTGSQTSKNPSG